MTASRRHFVILNSASGPRRGRRRIAAYRRLLKGALECHVRDHGAARTERELSSRPLGTSMRWSSGRRGRHLEQRRAGPATISAAISGSIRAVPRTWSRRSPRVSCGMWTCDAWAPRARPTVPDRWESRHFLNVEGFGFDAAVIDAAGSAFPAGGALQGDRALPGGRGRSAVEDPRATPCPPELRSRGGGAPGTSPTASRPSSGPRRGSWPSRPRRASRIRSTGWT